jgi:hypothetical protein
MALSSETKAYIDSISDYVVRSFQRRHITNCGLGTSIILHDALTRSGLHPSLVSGYCGIDFGNGYCTACRHWWVEVCSAIYDPGSVINMAHLSNMNSAGFSYTTYICSTLPPNADRVDMDNQQEITILQESEQLASLYIDSGFNRAALFDANNGSILRRLRVPASKLRKM